ncbi:hypothetical protein CYMTET_3250 [Cymbomonas tetramitiformis]|uniref:PsbP C-terminal domain-containing protein n=1 Tax=Cymbomonas tetramitiformis TaxID=36881 RepID=A0AAE0H3N8_9CHLO|nr:hypothetical protein CYMTET_3250 [Cymbomonas tetramitiformis]
MAFTLHIHVSTLQATAVAAKHAVRTTIKSRKSARAVHKAETGGTVHASIDHPAVLDAGLKRRTALLGLALSLPLSNNCSIAAENENNDDDDDDDDGYAGDVKLPEFDDKGKVISNEEIKPFVTKTVGAASYQVPGFWSAEGDSGWKDPVLGRAVDSIEIVAIDTKLNSMTDLGRLENVKVAKSLPVPAELAKADLLGGKKQVVDGVMYYQWDLVTEPATCAPEKQIIQGQCLPEFITMLSACVIDGKLYVMTILAAAESFKFSGKSLRALRDSFSVAAA